ncbi:helix-turn-helix domain-containing protein [Sphingobacterium siyangense]|uniref:helix-turn-helix domain-containing protein n=1 Tax=Sphingobacterium siyangense TaxID=459529 RepID=UPI0019657071|nr:AraC family transcriptional regulator [Sphingobacterium siyangense]QRY58269.1 AraC family transcriptional regulator [Sphingobacterium siyangense]
MEFGVHRVSGVTQESSEIRGVTAKENYIVLFVSSGGCSMLINKQTAEIEEYSLVLIPRGITVDANPNEQRFFLIIYFSESFFARTEVDTAFLRNFKSFNKSEYTYRMLRVPQEYATYYEFVGMQLKLSKQNYNQAIYRDLAHNIVKQIVLLAAIYAEDKQSGELLGKSTEVSLVRHFQDLVEKHVKTEKQVAFYADQLNIGSKKLTNLTKEVLGVTPKGVIMAELLRISKKLIVESSLSIKEIAWELGYTDVNNFSTFFLKETMVTPTEYRKSNQ